MEGGPFAVAQEPCDLVGGVGAAVDLGDEAALGVVGGDGTAGVAVTDFTCLGVISKQLVNSV